MGIGLLFTSFLLANTLYRVIVYSSYTVYEEKL